MAEAQEATHSDEAKDLKEKQWRMAQIREGIRQADAGEGIDHSILMSRLRRKENRSNLIK